MKTPFFWYQPRGFLSRLLCPLGWLYEKGSEIKYIFRQPRRFSKPIISIGNIISGGAGKTPTAIALGNLLQQKGLKIHFVTRGYGGILKGPLKVDPLQHKATDVGDEPLLLAQQAPTWVSKDRPQGVQKAIEDGADLIILDDGHQTHGLSKDVSFVVVDLIQGFGNGCVIPAGPLRESREKGLKRADAIIGVNPSLSSSRKQGSMKNTENKIESLKEVYNHNECHFHCSMGPRVTRLWGDDEREEKSFFRAQVFPQPLSFPLSSNRVIAFCGLGFPQKFYASLEKLGFTLLATESFPDHYDYKEKDLIRLQSLARNHEANLITTRKDWVKLPPSWQSQIYVLDIIIQFEEPEQVFQFILNKIPALEKRG